MSKTIFITGATGNIGGMLLCHLLEDQSIGRIIALVRAESVSHAARRIAHTVKTLRPELQGRLQGSRLRIVTGDITQAGLGMTNKEYAYASANTTHLIHCAACTQFNIPLDRARSVNCTGAANVMDFATDAVDGGRLQRVGYVSTAYVNGHCRGVIGEDELSAHPRFCNNYEQSKFEAERYVRSLMDRLPVCIFRPAIVVGDSRTGQIIDFNVLYSPLKHICSGAVSLLPGSPDTVLDVVPVDYVAQAISHILLVATDPIGKTFNLTAGVDNSLSVQEIVSTAVKHASHHESRARHIRMRFVPMFLFRAIAPLVCGKTKRLIAGLEAYAPYISYTRTFDDTNTRRALDRSGIRVPRFADYIDNVMILWLTARRGRRLRTAA